MPLLLHLGTREPLLGARVTGWDLDDGDADSALVEEDDADAVPEHFDDVRGDDAMLSAPVGSLVPTAFAALDRGGTLPTASIHLSDVPRRDHQCHLFEERTLRSVTANTRPDREDFLEEAARIGLRVFATKYPMAEADTALRRPAARARQRRCATGELITAGM